MNETLTKYKHEVTEQIIRALTAGNAPWQKPLLGGQAARNAITGRRYQGINQIILRLKDENADPRWLTYKQAQERGWRVKQGSHGIRITFWKPLIDLETEEQIGQVQRIFTVFNATQIEGISEYKPVTSNFELSNINTYTQGISERVTRMHYPEAMKQLINEISNMFLMCELGMDYQPLSASRTQENLQILSSNSSAIFKASAEASRTVDFVLGHKEG